MRTRGLVTVGLVLLALGSVGVAAANEAPLAEAGLDQDATVNTTVYLDAGGSVDPDGSIARYQWTVEAPGGSTRAPDCGDCPTTWFVPSQEGQYNVTVRVVDDSGATAEDTLYVNVISTAIVATGPPSGSAGGPGGTGGGSPGGWGGGGVPSAGAGSCPGCSGSSGGSIDALLERRGGETLIAAGVIEPGDTVTVDVAGGENLAISGEEFIQAGDGSARVQLNEFSAEMAEIGLAPSDVDRSMTRDTINPNYESTSRVESRTLDDRMEAVNNAIESSPLSGLHLAGADEDSETADEDQFEEDASDQSRSDGDNSESGQDITFGSSSTSGPESPSEGSTEDSGITSGLSDYVGPIGPNP